MRSKKSDHQNTIHVLNQCNQPKIVGFDIRVALWGAMHVEVDPPPHVLEDEIGLKLAAPDENWRRRPDMNPQFTSPFRASIVARARFIEDLVFERAGHGVGQYVLLAPALTPSPSAGRRSPPGLRYLKSISRVLSRGSGSA